MIGLKSGVRIIHMDPKTGKKLSDDYHDNLLTNTGKDVIMNKLINAAGYTAETIATKIGVGRNNTVVSASNLALSDGNAVKKDIASMIYSAYRLVMNVTFETNEANFEWKETGLFRGDTLIARVVLPQPSLKSDQVRSVAQWEFSFAEGV